MPANPWELRADLRPLDVAATRWIEVAELMSRRGDEIVDAAKRATEGWDAAAAESYELHRRQVLINLDRFTTLATQIAGSLRAIGAILASSQKELDQAWTKVALVPHEFVGESRYLVFKPDVDEDRAKVDNGRAETDEIRRRLTLSLDQESSRLRASRAELVMVRTELTTLGGGTFGEGGVGPGLGPGLGPGVLPGIGPSLLRGIGPGGEASGVGTIMPAASASASTSVLGSAQSGIAASALAPVAPISVSMPHLTGLSASALAPFIATAAGGIAGRKASGRTNSSATPPMGGMGAGAMGARAGSMSRGMSRGMAGGRAGTSRLATPQLPGTTDEEAARIAREKQAEKEAKQAALADKRAERAARKAERERSKDDKPGTPDEVDESTEPDTDDEPGESTDEGTGGSGERPAAITVVHYAPGEEPANADVPDADRGVDAGDVEGLRRS